MPKRVVEVERWYCDTEGCEREVCIGNEPWRCRSCEKVMCYEHRGEVFVRMKTIKICRACLEAVLKAEWWEDHLALYFPESMRWDSNLSVTQSVGTA